LFPREFLRNAPILRVKNIIKKPKSYIREIVGDDLFGVCEFDFSPRLGSQLKSGVYFLFLG